MTGHAWTALFLGLWVAAAVVWDVYALRRWGSAAAISEVVYEWRGVVGFIVGGLCYHLFWPKRFL